MFGSKVLLAGSLLLLALVPVGVLAADIKTQSSTRYLWYNDPFQDKTLGNPFQYRFVSGDPGADVHNDWFSAQRLYDSLDEMDDGVLI